MVKNIKNVAVSNTCFLLRWDCFQNYTAKNFHLILSWKVDKVAAIVPLQGELQILAEENKCFLFMHIYFLVSFIHPHHRKSPRNLNSKGERSIYVTSHLDTASLCMQAGYSVYKYTKIQGSLYQWQLNLEFLLGTLHIHSQEWNMCWYLLTYLYRC